MIWILTPKKSFSTFTSFLFRSSCLGSRFFFLRQFYFRIKSRNLLEAEKVNGKSIKLDLLKPFLGGLRPWSSFNEEISKYKRLWLWLFKTLSGMQTSVLMQLTMLSHCAPSMIILKSFRCVINEGNEYFYSNQLAKITTDAFPFRTWNFHC